MLTRDEIIEKIDAVIYSDNVIASDAVVALGMFMRTLIVNIRYNFGEECAHNTAKLLINIAGGLVDDWPDVDEQSTNYNQVLHS